MASMSSRRWIRRKRADRSFPGSLTLRLPRLAARCCSLGGTIKGRAQNYSRISTEIDKICGRGWPDAEIRGANSLNSVPHGIGVQGMDFGYSPKVEALREKMLGFMD